MLSNEQIGTIDAELIQSQVDKVKLKEIENILQTKTKLNERPKMKQN